MAHFEQNGHAHAGYGPGHSAQYEKPDEAALLGRYRTAESVTIPKDVFEKLYLSPEQPTAGDLRKRFANPTPVALVGFLLAATPNACQLMGWRGAGGGGSAYSSLFVWFGGFLQIVGGLGEWILGNTYSTVLFFTYGAFWLTQAGSLMPAYAVGAGYSTTGNSFEGAQTPEYFATEGFYLCFMGVVTAVFCVGALRTNVVLLSILLILVAAFGCLTAAYWELALGHAKYAGTLLVTGGALAFAFCVLTIYLLLIQIMEAVDFPFTLPVGDLSGVVKGSNLIAEARRRDSLAAGEVV